MRRSENSKTVSWPSAVNLSQVKLFLSENAPSQVRSSGTQDHLQGNVSWQEQLSGVRSHDNLPRGFEGISQPSNLWRVNLYGIPLIKWKSPPRFMVNSNWRVVAGEESSETEVQNQRELSALEAIYPRPSAIPPNPTLLASDSIHNDHTTPMVPTTPIEDEDSVPGGSTSANSIPVVPQLRESFSYVRTITPDIAAAAKAALSVLTPNNYSSTLIDSELLVKILSDPKMVELLAKNHTTFSTMTTMQAVPPPPPPPRPLMSMSSSVSTQFTRPLMTMSSSVSTQFNTSHVGTTQRNSFDLINVPRPNTICSMSATAPFYHQSTVRPVANVRLPIPDIITSPSPFLPIPVKKDINYYKSLIQRHGAEKQGNLPQIGMSQVSLIQQHRVERGDSLPQFTDQSKQQFGRGQEVLNFTQSKPKIKKPCIYFNTSRGCWNGASCLFQHSEQRVTSISDVPSAKRMKLDREITGT